LKLTQVWNGLLLADN